MKFKSILLATSVISITVISCKKDGGTSSNSKQFEGTWNFTGLHSETAATDIITEGGSATKSVTYSVYDSKNNTGTIKFEGGTATGTGVGYSVDTSFIAYEYEDNVLIDSTTEPFQFTASPANSTSGYKLVGSDSLTFTGSGLVAGNGTSGSASGGHYSVADNKMTITTAVLKDSSFTQGTAVFNVHETATVKIYLQK